MNVLPVIARELRVQARQPFTYRLRLLGVLALLATCGWFLSENSSDKNIGGALFATLHGTLFYATLVLVTISAVDGLSRERREGTLGLLLLTPLSVVDIVFAKVMAHGLRALTLMLAAVPVFALPMLLGGVAWSQMVETLLLLASAICLALGAAILASAWFKTWVRALVIAIFMVIGGWLFFTISLGLMLHSYVASTNSNFSFAGGFDYLWLRGLAIASGGLSSVDWGPGAGASAASQYVVILAQVTGLALVWLLAAIYFASRRIQKVWREEPSSARRQWVERKLTTPVVGLNVYKGWMRRMLERNPVGWLQRRAWQGRVVMWSWLAIVITVTSSTLGDNGLTRHLGDVQWLLAQFLIVYLAATVAGSFRRERETGMLELLLVSPLTARRIIVGRLQGLWGQIGPAAGLFALVWLYLMTLLYEDQAALALAMFLLLFVTVPAIGLYFSLRCQSFIGAFLLTIAFGLILPLVSERVTNNFLDPQYFYRSRFDEDFLSSSFVLAAAMQVMLAMFLLWLTERRLEGRRFNFERVTA